MIVKIPLVLAIVNYINGVSSASFSKVFVQKGPDYPVDYVQYGAPSVPYSPQIAQLTAAPVGSVVPYASNYVPCGTPCVYPGQVASVAPSANIVQYQSPSLPVVVAPARTEPSGYEYSYVVYDEKTGDHKAQREHSDGSSVRGGYTFLQPDGFVREVQYIADDAQGFNAVVKNYLPVETKKLNPVEKPEVDPCLEVKHDKNANLLVHAETIGEHEPQTELHEVNKGHTDSKPNKEHEAAVETLEEKHQINEPSKAEHVKPLQVNIEVEEQHETHEIPHEAHKEAHEHQKHFHEHVHVPEHHKIQVEPAKTGSEESVIRVYPAVQETHVAVTDRNMENNVLISYNDIIRCIQSSLSNVHEPTSTQRPESPLTYIVLNRPCYLNKN